MATTPQTNTTFQAIADELRTRDGFVICGHVGPDGDCLGSQLALMHALAALGKSVTCVLVRDEPIDRTLMFLPSIETMVPASDFKGACTTFIGVDVPTRERIGEAACGLLDQADFSITIDHHAAETTMCDLVYVDPDAASASILVWEVVKLLVDKPPRECALCAYAGLMTDTGGFCFQNADARAFAAAADMVMAGADPAFVATQVFQNRSEASLRLEMAAISRMKLLGDGQAALSWITVEDFERFGATKADAEPLIDMLRSIAGIRVACMLREQPENIRGSLRAKDDTDVAALARELGGGGHRAAAGITLEKPLEEAIALMEQKLIELL